MKAVKYSLDLTWWSLIKVVIVVVALQFFVKISDILALLFLVFIFVAALSPIVTRLQKHMPRLLAVTIIYLSIFAFMGIASTIMFQPLASQIGTLATLIPQKFNEYLPLFAQLREGSDLVNDLANGLKEFSGILANFSGSLIDTTFGIFGGLFTVFTVLVLTFYLLLEEQAMRHFVNNIVPNKNRAEMTRILNKISLKMGSWVRGQLALMIIIGLVDFIILLILGVEAPLPLAVWAGLMEVVPYLGPILGAIPAVVVALATGTPLQALLVAIIMIVVVQQLEGQFLVPKIMQKAVGLSPVIVIVALLIGGKIFGIIGALLAIPVTAVLAVMVQEWPHVQKVFNNGE